ncbi:MAG: lipid II flippase MurJ [Phormidium sp.]
MKQIREQKWVRKIWRSATQRVMSLTFMGMMLGLLVDVLIAAKLGAGQTADALIIALSLPLLIDTVTREGTRFSLVPMFMERQAAMTKDEYRYFVSGVLNLALLIGIGATIVIEVLAPWIVVGMAAGLEPEAKTEAALLLRTCAPLVIFALGGSVLSVLLNSQKRFSLVALRNTIAPAIVVVSIALAWNQENFSLWVTIAYVIGFALFFFTLFVGDRNSRHTHHWSVLPSKDQLIDLWDSTFLPTLGFFVRQGSRIVDRLLASLVAVGGVSAYYFAFRLFSAVQTLVGISIATTGLPAMTDHSLAGNKTKLAKVIRKNIIKALLISLAPTIFILVFNNEIISFLYGHGLFNNKSIEQTSQILLGLGLGLPFCCVLPVLQSGLYAQKAYKAVFRNRVTITLANILLAYLLSQWLGLVGIAMAVSLSTALAFWNLIYLLNQSGVTLLKKTS